ncbi:MAG: ubiquitin-conjugating enzyme E2 [Gaeavirus sp.]|uniref:E2 ubiquitin-conjugating enzyme n=1 Tax=Gaeavirus sp. TaxID=2487767 RepID=A0A3G5A1A9_9VIRU|nr:MAG: ubiquitin-conjugating enzyme E2 [Gaeavirus sp.]
MAINPVREKRFVGDNRLLRTAKLHYITAYQSELDPLEWPILIQGQKGTHYEGGQFIGKIVHSPSYPAKPPKFLMLTPSGRYEVNKPICITISDYHAGEWSSAWNINTILVAFYSIFQSDVADEIRGISHLNASKAERKVFADASIAYNLKYHENIYTKFDFSGLSDCDPALKPKIGESVSAGASDSIPKVSVFSSSDDFDFDFGSESPTATATNTISKAAPTPPEKDTTGITALVAQVRKKTKTLRKQKKDIKALEDEVFE